MCGWGWMWNDGSWGWGSVAMYIVLAALLVTVVAFAMRDVIRDGNQDKGAGSSVSERDG